MSLIAGRRVGSHEIFDLQEEPGSQEEEPALDIMAFPENIFAGILQSLPPEQLLNVSRVETSLPCLFIMYVPLQAQRLLGFLITT